MQDGFFSFLKGDFLTSKDSLKTWVFIVYITVLAMIMIASSHQAEQKVYEVAELNQELQELRSEFVDTRKRLMRLKMESNIADMMSERGIYTSLKPAYKIVVKSEDE
ncbi:MULTISPECIES: FtsL-like putative cell division protein [Psychroflexus]|uniref:S-adenosyl-methyltransferase n=1 Tax=Psychroflexus halocasei TaxID=908615 RepID=A0A1H3XHX6_9FLAO|nr:MULTISPECIES: FtsL-like putative cell division protein [Psychroflexus]PJX23935.1 S-adenosyl-methyltransferase [Psychroflexus sp. S27]SDZ99007.1 hypothetical protein SAMN05421540_102370 [Psychroflexus halocasei]